MIRERHCFFCKNIFMKVNNKWLIYALLGVLVLGIIFWPKVKSYLSGNPDTSRPSGAPSGSQAREPLHVDGYLIKPGKLIDEIRSVGTLMPEEEVNVTFESSGKLTQILFKEGQLVRKGDLLAKINDKPLLAQLQKLEAQKKLAESKEFRQRSLLEKEAVSQEAYDQAATELEAIMADIALVEARIYETELRAPFDGTIGLRFVSEGTYVSPATNIAKLTKVSSLKLDFAVPERYSGTIKKGTEISFVIDGDLNKYNAQVYAVDSKVDEVMRTIMVRAIFPNQTSKLFPGRFASINIVQETLENVVAIPAESIIPEMGKEKVFVYKSGKAVSKDIHIGLRTESHVEVKQGLSFGDTLITTGILQLRESLPVNLSRVIDLNYE